jgi:hypothetical protein
MVTTLKEHSKETAISRAENRYNTEISQREEGHLTGS